MKRIILIGLVISMVFLVGCQKDMITTNIELELECAEASLNYDNWREAPECKEYIEFHEKYEQWLLEQ